MSDLAAATKSDTNTVLPTKICMKNKISTSLIGCFVTNETSRFIKYKICDYTCVGECKLSRHNANTFVLTDSKKEIICGVPVALDNRVWWIKNVSCFNNILHIDIHVVNIIDNKIDSSKFFKNYAGSPGTGREGPH